MLFLSGGIFKKNFPNVSLSLIFSCSASFNIAAHNGSNRIFYSDLIWFKEEKAIVLLFTNTATRNASNISWDIERMLFEPEFNPEPFQLPLSSKIIDFSLHYSGNLDNLAKELKLKFLDALNDPNTLNEAGYVLMQSDHLKESIALFNVNTLIHPDNGNLWDSLGEAYFYDKNYNMAKKVFTKALHLRIEDNCSWCENSEYYLKKISKIN